MPQRPPQYMGGGSGFQPAGPTRPRKPLGGRILLLGIAVVIGFIVLVALMNGSSSNDEHSGDERPSSQTKEAPKQKPQYQNETYEIPPISLDPPPIPIPETVGEAEQVLTSDALYSQRIIRPVRCDLKPLRDNDATPERLQSYLSEVMVCLVRVWGPTLEASGHTPIRPKVTVYENPVKTPCGDLKLGNAVFCAGNQQVYVAHDLITIIPRALRQERYVFDTILAHEYGHAVQARSGILASQHGLAHQAEKPLALELARRLETQADCFAGAYFNSTGSALGWKARDQRVFESVMRAIGDDRLSGDPDVVGNHGHGSSRLYWAIQGEQGTTLQACSTFTAPREKVR